ncbi:hypothetical protein [Deinococcus sp. 12RED42]|uniref:hypothetical protein n=1 Tax=Deinococcus sp. 12RED42 TaxID=2745872 RepID=UPI001E3A30F3|nr:hypothetical protein [Deinococcus sp. 12RED42]MCD0167003.1 hypothetical protein [Deinococcus sp. 12RED42]
MTGTCARCADTRTILTQMGVAPCPLCAELPAGALTRAKKGQLIGQRLPHLIHTADRTHGRAEYIPPSPDLAPLIRLAWTCGYTLAVHGSLERDLDLIACPWTEDAVSPDDLVSVLIDQGRLKQRGPWVDKPHGRRGLTLRSGTDAWTKHIDLSVMPRLKAVP